MMEKLGNKKGKKYKLSKIPSLENLETSFDGEDQIVLA